MRRKIITHLTKKELIDVIRDKKTVFAMIGIPLLMYPILMVAMSFFMQMTMEEANSERIKIAIIGEEIDGFLPYAGELYENVDFIQDGEDCHYTIIFQESSVRIQYNSSEDITGLTIGDLQDLFGGFQRYQLEQALEDAGVTVAVMSEEDIIVEDVASNTVQIGKLIGQVLPLFLIMGVLLGVIYPAIDIVAGEKERNTLETLRSLPITPLEIVVSKFGTIVLCGIVSTLLNLLSISLSLGYFINSMAVAYGNLGIFQDIQLSQLIIPIGIAFVCLFIFTFFVSAISMIIVSFASSFKEAQNYITPLMLAIILPGYITLMPSISLNTITSVIPVVNIALLIKEAFTFELQTSYIFVVIASNLSYSLFAMIILGKVFNREEILFGNQKNFRLLEGRASMVQGGLPGVSDAVAVFAIGMVVLLYSGGVLVRLTDNTALQIVGTQLILLLVPVAYGIYIKSDFKRLFRFHSFAPKYLLIGIPLMVAGLLLTATLQGLLLQAIPALESVLEELSATLLFDNKLLYLMIAALLPAVCEELFFRGFVLTGLQLERYPIIAICVSSLMFGIFHMNVFQLITGIVLGGVLGFVTYKSKSIYPAMVLHFMNNAIAILISG